LFVSDIRHFSAVTKTLKIWIKSITLFLLLTPFTINAQILRDTAALRMVKVSIDNIYNLRFNDARDVCRKLNLAYPGHSVTYLLYGMITYWENYPLLTSSPERVSYERDMRKCIELCEGKHDPADEAEFLLANLSARGMLLLFYTDNNLTKDVFPLAASTYHYIRRSFDYTSVYTDFYFFAGLYNYYREAYPEAYPAYKALAFLFPKGDRIKGLNDLQTAATKSILFKAEASLFLSEICLSFENDYVKAYEHSKYLHELYPANIEYLSMYIKNLLLIKQYDEAEKHVRYMESLNSKSYFRAQLSIYNGILQEKKYHNNKMAAQYYTKGINEMLTFENPGNEFAAYGYFGLSRISNMNNDINSGKTFLKKAVELAYFTRVDFD
jgi:hypothetical protein